MSNAGYRAVAQSHWNYRHFMPEGALHPACDAPSDTPWTTTYRRNVDCPACLDALARDEAPRTHTGEIPA